MSETQEAKTGEVVQVKQSGVGGSLDGEPGWSLMDMGSMFASGAYTVGRRSDILKISVSLACWEVIGQDIAKTPLQLRRRTNLGSEIVQPDEHPIARLLWRAPSPYYSWSTWLRMAGSYLAAMRGFYIAGKWTLRRGFTEIQGIPAHCVRVLTNVDAGRYFYEVNPTNDHERIQWNWCLGKQSDEVVRPMLLRTLNGIDPIGNDLVAGEALRLLGLMQGFQSDSFRNGGVPVYAICFPDEMEDEQFNRIKADMEDRLRTARETGKPIILEGNGTASATITKLSTSATEQDFVKAHADARNDVLRYYRMPPHKVMIFSDAKYDNLESINRLYVDDTLMPIFQCITDAMDKLLLADEEDEDLFFAFDTDAAYNMDPKARNEITEKRWKAGMINFDEMRAAIGLNKVGGDLGGARMVSGNFMFFDDKLKVLLKAGGNTPGAEGDQAPQDDAGNNAPQE